MKWWQSALLPLAVLYDGVTRLRNHLYNIEFKKSFAFQANVVAVGNLSVGGTGKTPMVFYLIDHFLSQGKKVATLSRGYGRKTKGLIICDDQQTADSVGDEPFSYYLTYGEKVMVTVSEDRAIAIPFMLAEEPHLDVIIMDDAFQHRSVKPSFSILLTTQQKPFWKDWVLPSGRLREARKGASRADAVVVTKTADVRKIEELDRLGKPYFNTYVDYGKPVPLAGSTNPVTNRVVAVAGLADNAPFFKYVADHYEVINQFSFKDHHAYKKADIKAILKDLPEGTTILTTQKDAVKMMQFGELHAYSCAYIPIKIKFRTEEEHFLQMLNQSLKEYSINS